MNEEFTPKSKVVEAVGLAMSTRGRNKGSRAQMIEAAMQQAIVDAQAEGITDPDEMRNRMLNARDVALGRM